MTRKIVMAAAASALLAVSTPASAAASWASNPDGVSWGKAIMNALGVSWG